VVCEGQGGDDDEGGAWADRVEAVEAVGAEEAEGAEGPISCPLCRSCLPCLYSRRTTSYASALSACRVPTRMSCR